MISKEKLSLISEIACRASDMNLQAFDRVSLMMDLKLATEKFNLGLEELLNADDFNFAHDVVGIQNHIDRNNAIFKEFFLPRFSNVNERRSIC